jgi:hypothetical protein
MIKAFPSLSTIAEGSSHSGLESGLLDCILLYLQVRWDS